MKRNAFLVALACSMVLAACSKNESSSTSNSTTPDGSASSGAKVLKFSAIPNQNATELKTKFDPIAEYLSKELDVKVEFVPSADYKASVEAFKNGDLKLAWFGGVTGVQARNAVPGAQAIVQGKEDTQFKSYFVAHNATGLEKSDSFPAAIGGMKFCFGSETSTSGRVMPSYFIKQNTGKSEKEFFTQPLIFSGSHDKTLEAVASGSAQVGVCDYTVYDKLVASAKIDPAVVKVIWETPTYQDYNFTAHPALETEFGAGFTEKLQKALIGMSTAAPQLLSAFPRKELIAASNADFKNLADLCAELGIR